MMGHKPRLMSAGVVACLVFLLAPATANKCIVGCHGMNPSKAYDEGVTYIYDLEGTSVTSVSEAHGESRLKLNAIVEMAVKPNCVHQLRVKNVRVNGATVALSDLDKHALEFNYHGGHIDTSVCAEAGDSQASLNIKRAVISLFQSAVMQDSGSTVGHETDVFGGCKTEYNFHKEGDSLVVHKYRNLGECSHRENIRHGLITGAFDPSAEVKSSPLLASKQKVEQRFKRGVLDKAVSSETYVLRPFSNGDAGATSVVETTLTLKGRKNASPTGQGSQLKSLIFEAPHPVVDSSVAAIVKALKAVKEECPDSTIKEHAAVKFADLVKVVGLSSKDNILTVYHQVKSGTGFDKKTDKKILLDALFRSGSGEAAEVVVELIKNHQVVGLEALAYYASLALVRHVNAPTVAAVTSLLDQPDLPRIGYLGIGHVIGKYCEQHECADVPEVKAGLAKILSKIGNGKFDTREKENVAIASLKALGNARYHDDATTEKIAAIAADKKGLARVRVAAIEALPTSCSGKWKKLLFDVLGNREEDSEIRIKSYLALVKCADPQVANKIKQILEKETVNQVGSFITTHLRNLRASTDPMKQEAKRQLEHVKPRTKFPEDMRKYSFNNEFSYNVGAFGLGSTADSNVIYSQKSFVPRSASLNLTTEVFGHSFNFLEIDARVENLDRLIEHYFGPKGELYSNEINKLAADGKSSFNEVYDYVKERFGKTMRSRREVKQENLNKFAKKVHFLGGKEIDNDLDVDLSLKMFGVELAYLDYRSGVETRGNAQKANRFINKIFDILDKGIDEAKNFNHEIDNHLEFLNAEIVYPTGLGVPLSVGVTGSSVVKFKASGKIDLPAIVRDPSNAEVKIAVEPSAAISVVGNLLIDAFGVESGLRLISTLHTSTGSDVSFKLLKGSGVDISFGIPKAKQEIVSISSEVLFVDNSGKSTKYVSPKFTKGKQSSDCFDQLSSVLGLTVCGHVAYPYDSIESIQRKPIFPLSGPAKFALSVETNDVTSYHFRAYYDNEKPHEKSFEVVFETPGSKTDRRVSLRVEGALEPNKYFKVALVSPYKSVSAEVALRNTRDEHSLVVTANNDVDTYYLRAGVVSNGNRYKPVLEYKVPEHIEKLASSKTGVKTSSRDGQMYKVQGDVEANFENGGQRYNFNKVMIVASGRPLASLDGYVEAKPDGIVVDVKIAHGDENLAIKLNAARSADRRMSLDLSVVPSREPESGFKILWHYDRSDKMLDHSFVLVHGADLNSETNRLTYSEYLKYEKSEHSASFAPSYKYPNALKYENKITYPAQEFKSDFEIEVSTTSFQTEYDLKVGKFKIGTELEIKVDGDNARNIEIGYKAHILQSKIALKAKRKSLGEHRSKFEGSLELPGGKYEGEADLTYDVHDNSANVQLDSELKLNGKKIKVVGGLEANQQRTNSRAEVSVDSTKYLDFILKIQRGHNPHGNVNLNLKNLLILGGQFDYQNGKGNANVNVDLPKIGRKIKGTGEVSVSGKHHVANFEILYDADKDPSKRIKLSTVTDLTDDSIDSKNVIDILKYKTEVNVKGTAKNNGRSGHQVEGNIDITLPNDNYIVLKTIHHLIRDGKRNRLEGAYQIAHSVNKGGKTAKVEYKAKLAWDEGSDFEYIGKHGLLAESYEGQNIKVDVAANHERQKDSDKIKSKLLIKVQGSVMPKPFDFDLSANYNENDGDWKIASAYGKDLGVEGEGKYAKGDLVDKPSTSECILTFKFPSEKLKSLKYVSSKSVLLPHERGGTFALVASETLIYNDDNIIKGVLHLAHKGIPDDEHKSEGTAILDLLLPKISPMTITTTYNCDPTGETKKSSGTFKVQTKDNIVSVASDVSYGKNGISIDTKATTPVDKYRNVELKFAQKTSEDDKHEYDLVLVADEAKYTFNSELQLSPKSRVMKVVLTCPSGKTVIFSKYTHVNDKVHTGEWKIESPKGFVTADWRVEVNSIDSFVIEGNFDSDKIEHRKIHARIATQSAVKAGKRIMVTVTSDGKNIVTGNTNYIKRDEAGKLIVEGSGSLKIGDSTRSSNFKYTQKQLTREVDDEVGVAISLSASFEPSAIVGELKLSNKEILVSNSYCEQGKDCAQFKLQSAWGGDKSTYVNHLLIAEVDLKKFKVPVEFGFQSQTKYYLKEPQFDHTANLHVHTSKDKSQYSSQVYLHPKEAAIIITLPSRELAVISSYDIPKNHRHSEVIKLDVSAYLDRKNKPKEKLSFVFVGDVSAEKNQGLVKGKAKFSLPAQPKEMVVDGSIRYGGENLLDANLELDVFAKKNQKIAFSGKLSRADVSKGYKVTGEFEAKSHGQQLNVGLEHTLVVASDELAFVSLLSYNDVRQKRQEVGVVFELNAKQGTLQVKAINTNVVIANTKFTVTKDDQKMETEVAILDNPPSVFILGSNKNSFHYESYAKDNPEKKLVASGHVTVGKSAQVQADLVDHGKKSNLFNVLVHLDENNFLKPDFAYNNDNIATVVDLYREKVAKLSAQLRHFGKDVGDAALGEAKDLLQHLRMAKPNMKPVLDYYSGELKKLKSELHADETVKEIQAAFHKVFGGVFAAVTETLRQFIAQLTELNNQLHEIVSKVTQAIEATVPHLKESYEKILKAGVEVFDAATKLFATYVKAIFSVINAHQKEIKQLLGVAAELTRDIAKIISKGYAQIENDVREFVTLVVQQIKSLPIYEMLKEEFAGIKYWKVPEGILVPIEEAYVQLKKILPTEELQEFFTVIYDYVMKHVKREQVDDTTEVKKIYRHAIEAIQSVIELLRSRTNLEKLLSVYIVGVPADISAIKNLPGISTLRLSIINLVRNHELPSPSDLYYAYRPTLHPEDLIPPFSKHGIFLEGGHFFTFDGRHLTMAGTCDYILAQDMRDGNFSVVANLANGKLTSVTVTAPSESITIKSNGNILANGKPAEYPANTKNLHAFLTLPIVNVKSDYGVQLMCTPKSPMVCTVHVSGFYHGKLRGILGDANNEPYDDFTLPSGHITENEADFGNSYKLNSGCAAAPAVNHKSHQRNPTCTEYFSGSSSMSSCFNYVDPAPYRQACDHGAGASTPQAACLVASAYWAACRAERVFISIPAACGNCNFRGNKIAIGDSFSVKVPQKEADIVFVIEQDVRNEKVFKDLIQPLIAEVKSELKHQGVTDVHIGLIGFGQHMKWPQHYTTGGNINIDGHVNNIDFAKSEPLITFQEAKTGDYETRLKYVKQRLDVELGTFRLTDAYEEAIHYPFRIGAAKAVVGIIASTCEKSPLPISLQQLRLVMGQKVYRDLGLTYHHVSFLDEILVSGKPQKNIVGYDAHSAYTFADSSKKPLEGSSEVKNNLVLTSHDVCAGFAVSSGGAAFSANHFVDAKANQRKPFIKVTSRRIVESLVDTELEEDCVCQQYKGIDPHASCKIVGRKEKEPLVRHTKGGVKG